MRVFGFGTIWITTGKITGLVVLKYLWEAHDNKEVVKRWDLAELSVDFEIKCNFCWE